MQSLADHDITIATGSSLAPLPHDANACSLPFALLWKLLRTDPSRSTLFHATGGSDTCPCAIGAATISFY